MSDARKYIQGTAGTIAAKGWTLGLRNEYRGRITEAVEEMRPYLTDYTPAQLLARGIAIGVMIERHPAPAFPDPKTVEACATKADEIRAAALENCDYAVAMGARVVRDAVRALSQQDVSPPSPSGEPERGSGHAGELQDQ